MKLDPMLMLLAGVFAVRVACVFICGEFRIIYADDSREGLIVVSGLPA